MSERVGELVSNELAWARKVSVEIGVGHRPGVSIFDRLKDKDGIESGEVLHVSLDAESSNLENVTAGAVSHMDMAAFARSDFLNGQVSTMYIFNVFGEPRPSKLIVGPWVLGELVKKLKPGGEIVIGEHITPDKAKSLRDVSLLRDMGFSAELYDSPIAIEALLTKRYGLSEQYARAFVGQSEENKLWKGKEHAGFLLILSKK